MLNLSDIETKTAYDKAKKEGLNLSDYLRKIIVKAPVIHPVKVDMIQEIADEFTPIRKQIIEVANEVKRNNIITDEDYENLKILISEMQCIISNYLYSGDR